jgi:hypothetical protein
MEYIFFFIVISLLSYFVLLFSRKYLFWFYKCRHIEYLYYSNEKTDFEILELIIRMYRNIDFSNFRPEQLNDWYNFVENEITKKESNKEYMYYFINEMPILMTKKRSYIKRKKELKNHPKLF